MLAAIERGHGPVGVAIGWSGDDDHLDFGVIEQVLSGFVHPGLRIGCQSDGCARGISIADGDEVQASSLAQGPCMLGADGPEAEQAHAS